MRLLLHALLLPVALGYSQFGDSSSFYDPQCSNVPVSCDLYVRQAPSRPPSQKYSNSSKSKNSQKSSIKSNSKSKGSKRKSSKDTMGKMKMSSSSRSTGDKKDKRPIRGKGYRRLRGRQPNRELTPKARGVSEITSATSTTTTTTTAEDEYYYYYYYYYDDDVEAEEGDTTDHGEEEESYSDVFFEQHNNGPDGNSDSNNYYQAPSGEEEDYHVEEIPATSHLPNEEELPNNDSVFDHPYPEDSLPSSTGGNYYPQYHPTIYSNGQMMNGNSNGQGKGYRPPPPPPPHSSEQNGYKVIQGVPICLYDHSKQIFTTQCVDPTRNFSRRIENHGDGYACGCCSPNDEFTGHLPEYCPGSSSGENDAGENGNGNDTSEDDAVNVFHPRTYAKEEAEAEESSDGSYAADIETSSADAPFICPAETTQVCGRPDVFVYSRMTAICRQDQQTGEHKTHCVHPSLQDGLVNGDQNGTFSCGCCSEEDEGHKRPWYCTL